MLSATIEPLDAEAEAGCHDQPVREPRVESRWWKAWMSLGPTRQIRAGVLVIALLWLYLEVAALSRADWGLAVVPAAPIVVLTIGRLFRNRSQRGSDDGTPDQAGTHGTGGR